MLAIFCARVAFGLVACLLLLSPGQLHPRFFRTHFVTALGLLIVATVASWSDVAIWPRVLLAASSIVALLGTISWTLEPAPAGRLAIVATAAFTAAALLLLEPPSDPEWPGELPPIGWLAAGVSSAMLLGTALTAMLVGHSYLISPGMALTPLMRCLLVVGITLVVRVAMIGWGLWRWTELTPTYNLNNEVVLWLLVRWLVGIIAPLLFGWMAFSAARIRSTQSATGILYVVVVCGFLGELLGLLLSRQTGLPL
ncbi:MAG TPA: hypothetical protein VH120_04545 [Gemmataceae bacterium]|jgi:hypothetical protein|nr:hypothetical protein [Gemmataceae bacterium]